MAKTLTAVYENGVLRPMEPLSLPEHERLIITIAQVTPEEEVLDTDYHKHLEEMNIREVSLEEVRKRLSKIPEALTDDFIAEREERF